MEASSLQCEMEEDLHSYSLTSCKAWSAENVEPGLMQISQPEEQLAPPGLLHYLDVGVDELRATATFSLFNTFTAKSKLLLLIQQQGGFTALLQS